MLKIEIVGFLLLAAVIIYHIFYKNLKDRFYMMPDTYQLIGHTNEANLRPYIRKDFEDIFTDIHNSNKIFNNPDFAELLAEIKRSGGK